MLRGRTRLQVRGLTTWTATHCEIEPDWLAFGTVHASKEVVSTSGQRGRFTTVLRHFSFGGCSTILDVNGSVRLPVYPAEIKELALRVRGTKMRPIPESRRFPDFFSFQLRLVFRGGPMRNSFRVFGFVIAGGVRIVDCGDAGCCADREILFRCLRVRMRTTRCRKSTRRPIRRRS